MSGWLGKVTSLPSPYPSFLPIFYPLHLLTLYVTHLCSLPSLTQGVMLILGLERRRRREKKLRELCTPVACCVYARQHSTVRTKRLTFSLCIFMASLVYRTYSYTHLHTLLHFLSGCTRTTWYDRDSTCTVTRPDFLKR